MHAAAGLECYRMIIHHLQQMLHRFLVENSHSLRFTTCFSPLEHLLRCKLCSKYLQGANTRIPGSSSSPRPRFRATTDPVLSIKLGYKNRHRFTWDLAVFLNISLSKFTELQICPLCLLGDMKRPESESSVHKIKSIHMYTLLCLTCHVHRMSSNSNKTRNSAPLFSIIYHIKFTITNFHDFPMKSSMFPAHNSCPKSVFMLFTMLI